MSTLTPERRKHRANLASAIAAAKRRPGDPDAEAQVAEAQRQYRYTAANEYIRKLVDQAPPLTDEQRRRLAAILQGDAA